LRLALVRPTGEIAAEKNLDWNISQQAAQPANTLAPAQ